MMTDDGFGVVITEPWKLMNARDAYRAPPVQVGTKPGLSKVRSRPFLGYFHTFLW